MDSFNTVERITLRMNGFNVKCLGPYAVRNREYFGFGNDTILTFEVLGNIIVLNLKGKL